jgi:hypothetical protein
MKMRYVIVEVVRENGDVVQLPILFSHAFSNEQATQFVSAATSLAKVPTGKPISAGTVELWDRRVACSGFDETFGVGSRGRHDEILIESAEHL